ncbi:MAG: hypothetical protein ACREQL_14365 [Candidatus Binatia bacterium]
MSSAIDSPSPWDHLTYCVEVSHVKGDTIPVSTRSRPRRVRLPPMDNVAIEELNRLLPLGKPVAIEK